MLLSLSLIWFGRVFMGFHGSRAIRVPCQPGYQPPSISQRVRSMSLTQVRDQLLPWPRCVSQLPPAPYILLCVPPCPPYLLPTPPPPSLLLLSLSHNHTSAPAAILSCDNGTGSSLQFEAMNQKVLILDHELVEFVMEWHEGGWLVRARVPFLLRIPPARY